MEFVRLDGERLTLVFALEVGGAADLVYLGARLPEGEDLGTLAASGARGRHESQPDVPPVPGVLPESKGGWSGTPALELRRSGVRIETDCRLNRWATGSQAAHFMFHDRSTGIDFGVRWVIGPADVVTVGLTLTNTGTEPVAVERLASLALPVPARFTEMTRYSGRWAGEMQEHRRPIAPDGIARESATGKPGFGGANWLLLHAGEEVLGAHLGWSGDHWLALEPDAQGAGDGRAMLLMGAVLEAGEVVLGPGENFAVPQAVLALAADRSMLAQTFHGFLRKSVLPARAEWGPRKVHLNSWEALGFDLSEAGLMRLAESAAALGIERFVLDDGWFGGRRDDKTSLGDWFVSQQVFPNGLAPLISRVHELGMDFGLWVEPEMVSPDSDLYRAHPDWCLHVEGRDRPTMRGQLALDLTRAEVQEYLFEKLDALLRDHPIAYLKWDHNRDLFPAGGKRFIQTFGFYALLHRLRAAHPEVEIESCSSGGGRIDFGVLQRTHRVWPSDNNDAIERLRIIPAWSQFLPLEVLGSHVGPSPNPITGRRLAMDFRAKVAVLGHMGVEADPARMTDKERDCLAAHIALYKQWRGVLHAGALHRLAHPDQNVTGMMVTHDDKALALVAQTAFSPVFDAAPLRLAGLEPEARYRVTLPEPWPAKARHYLANSDVWREGLVLSGTALMTQGLALPLTHPETAWLIALERVPQ
ncbi:alpha-galactosidase [Erythrobacter sp. CCH5-A1]|uniref:alpha-galactosidase n=1 Tax=Erythrobacter sp. CCH5-A1 TaxID=1768792 RepID=UPI0008372D6A|nr:alpha-galactosidase [Erythrobacter sp. CCH5-A1]